MARGLKIADLAFLGRVGNQFSPMSFAAIGGWLRADSFTDLSDGDSIGVAGNEWIDQSGNGRDAIQNGIQAVPTWESNEVNGLPVARFSDVFLQTSLAFPEISFAGDFTVILACSTKSATDTLWVNHRTANHQLRRNVGGGNDAASYAGLGFHSSSAFSGASNVFQLLTYRRSGTTFSWRQNKTARGTSAEAAQNLRLNTLCNNGFLGGGSGDLGEIVFYSAHRSDAEVDSLYDGYFKPRWTTLP